MKRERADTSLEFSLIFCCSSNILVCWFCLHSCESGIRPLFGADSKMGATTLSHFQLTVFISPANQFSNLKSSPYFHQVSEGGTHLFPVVSHLCRGFETTCFFLLVIFNYHSHSSDSLLFLLLSLPFSRN